LAEVQFENVDFVIDFLPTYKNMPQLDKIVRNFNIIEGKTPETSGGLLISLPPKNVAKFMRDLKERGEESWIVGRVVNGDRKASLSKKVEILEV